MDISGWVGTGHTQEERESGVLDHMSGGMQASVRIANPKEFAAHFALAVTEQTHIGAGGIAKNGEGSLFRIFQVLLPQVSLQSRTSSPMKVLEPNRPH